MVSSGGFNEIAYSFEKSRGRPYSESQMFAFCLALQDCDLNNLGFLGRWFTWERGILLPLTSMSDWIVGLLILSGGPGSLPMSSLI